MAAGSWVKAHSRTSPRIPCAAPIWATQTRSVTAQPPRGSARGRRGAFALGSRLSLRLALLARHGALRITPRLTLHHPGLIEKAQHAVARQGALGEPGLHLVEIELQPLGLLLRE